GGEGREVAAFPTRRSSDLLPETLPEEDRHPLRVGPLIGGLVGVGRHRGFQRLAMATTFVFAAQFIYVVAAPIIVVDLLGKGEQEDRKSTRLNSSHVQLSYA